MCISHRKVTSTVLLALNVSQLLFSWLKCIIQYAKSLLLFSSLSLFQFCCAPRWDCVTSTVLLTLAVFLHYNYSRITAAGMIEWHTVTNRKVYVIMHFCCLPRLDCCTYTFSSLRCVFHNAIQFCSSPRCDCFTFTILLAKTVSLLPFSSLWLFHKYCAPRFNKANVNECKMPSTLRRP